MTPQRVEDVADALANRGFRYAGVTAIGAYRFAGEVEAAGSRHAVTLQVPANLNDLPNFVLDSPPDNLSDVLPHLGPGGQLCYAAKGTLVFDIYDPAGQTLAALDRATEVLDSALRGHMVKDLEEEFFAHWTGPPCFADLNGEALGWQEGRLLPSGTSFVITDDIERTKRKLATMECGLLDEAVIAVTRVKLDVAPRAGWRRWPLLTVGDLLSWLGSLDTNCRKKVEQRIVEGGSKNPRGMALLMEAPQLTFGALIWFNGKYSAADEPASVVIRRHSITPVSLTRLDERYVAKRSIPGRRTLAGKRIALVGCGTIGGYLAELLVKMGAGTGGGELLLVDNDVLLPANLGRHCLGYPAMFRNKAVGLAEHLRRASPDARIDPMASDVRELDVTRADLVVNATGEEALGHWLAEKLCCTAPLLSTWIEGPGTAVRSLLRMPSRDTACCRCLWASTTRGTLLPVVAEQCGELLSARPGGRSPLVPRARISI